MWVGIFAKKQLGEPNAKENDGDQPEATKIRTDGKFSTFETSSRFEATTKKENFTKIASRREDENFEIEKPAAISAFPACCNQNQNLRVKLK